MIIMDNFYHFRIKAYVVTPYLNRLVETVQIRSHNMWFKLLMKNKKSYRPTTPSYRDLCVKSYALDSVAQILLSDSRYFFVEK